MESFKTVREYVTGAPAQYLGLIIEAHIHKILDLYINCYFVHKRVPIGITLDNILTSRDNTLSFSKEVEFIDISVYSKDPEIRSTHFDNFTEGCYLDPLIDLMEIGRLKGIKGMTMSQKKECQDPHPSSESKLEKIMRQKNLTWVKRSSSQKVVCTTFTEKARSLKVCPAKNVQFAPPP